MVAFYSALINPNGIEPMYSLLPSIFAKSSMLWSSLFYLSTNYIFNKKRGKSSGELLTRTNNRTINENSKLELEMTENAATGLKANSIVSKT